MSKISVYKEKLSYLFLFLVVVFALMLRILWLDRVPIAISDDELDYVLDAKAIFLSGKDLSGQWSPLSLTPAPYQVPKAELPPLIMAPLVGFMRLSLFSARLTHLIGGIILVILLYLIALRLFNSKVALIVGIVVAINPWSIYFSRTAFDVFLALIFYYAALLILIYSKGWKLLFAFPFLFFAFFSYIGTKLIFLPFVFIVGIYCWYFLNKKRFIRQYLILILLSLCVFSWFLVSLKSQPAKTRISELLTPFHYMVTQRVNDERRLSMRNPMTLLFSNKPVVFAKLFLEKYLGIFSADFLFLHGEARATYSMWFHGMFYYLDLVFLILGFCYLFFKSKKLWLFLTTLMAIAPLPAAFSTVGEEYALRGCLLYPILILFISLGVWFLISFKKEKAYKMAVTSFIIIAYFFQLFNFLNIYFFRNPIYNSEGFGFSNRILANYINITKLNARRILIITGNKLSAFKRYLFYSGFYNHETLPLVQEMIHKGKYKWENVYFLSKCPQNLVLNKKDVVILSPGSDCLNEEEYSYWLGIAQLSDGGEVFRIINDPVCYQFNLGRYPSGIKLADFKVEELEVQQFCQKFISDHTGYVNFRKNFLKL